MNSKGHLICSLVKSLLRILACILIVYNPSPKGVVVFSTFFLVAELLGVLEELLDMRK